MFRSKHSGWTWDLKRTPFGGGGGDIFQSVGNALASIDPGPAIGQGFAEADTFVNRELPGGWALPAIIVAAYLTGGGSLAAEGAMEAGAAAEGGLAAGEGAAAAGTMEGATAAGEAAYGEAIAAGASEAEATAAADAAANSYAYGSAATETPGATSVLSQPDVAVNLGGNTSGSFGSLNPALPAQGSVGGAGAGMSAQLAPSTVMGTGLPGGGAIGATYAAGANGLPATDFFGNYIPASSINTGGVPNTITGTTGTSTNNDLLKLLKQGVGSGLSKSLGQLAQGANPQGQELAQLVRSNQNPFTYTQNLPIQNKKPDLSSLAELLKQG